MKAPRALAPLPDDLIAKLRAAASAASTSEARTWLRPPGRTTRLLQALRRAIRAQSYGWYLHA